MVEHIPNMTLETACGTFFVIDKEDYDLVSKHTWHATDEKYIASNEKRDSGGYEVVRLHRVLLNPPKGKVVDHINRDVLDNRKSNLRIATRKENVWNSGARSTNTSGYKGVSFRKDTRKWRAQITVRGKRTNLGQFNCKHDAARMFNFWAKDLHGEFAWLNEIKEGDVA